MRTGCALVVLCGAVWLQACNCGGTGAPGDSGLDAGRDAGQDAGRVLGLADLQAAIIVANGDLRLLFPDGGSDLLVSRSDVESPYPLSPRWSPDGTQLAFADGRAGYVRRPDGGIDLASGGAGRGTRRVEWSPDGVRLAMDGMDPTSDLPQLYLATFDGGAPEVVAEADDWAWESSAALVFSRWDDEVGWRTERFELATRNSVRLEDAQVIAAAPDGRLVVQRTLDAADGGQNDVLLLSRPDGGLEALLPPGDAVVASPWDGVTLSPFGPEAAAVLTSRAGTTVVLWVSDAGVRTLAEGSFGNTTQPRCLRFVPGGQYLSYVAGDDPPELFVVSRDGEATRLGAPDLAPTVGIGCLDWRVAP